MEIAHVSLSKDISARSLFAIERLVNRKLHYTAGVIDYNVLRVVKRFPFRKAYFFSKAH